MDWNDLKIFLTVARKGTLGAAAQVLRQSQPTLGRRIRGLEQALGVTLFRRDGNGFALTSEGEAVLENVQSMEDEADALLRKLRCPNHLQGVIRVSSTDWFSYQVLAPIFARFSSDNPKLVIELVSETHVVSLSRREADLVFRFRQFEEPAVIQRKALRLEFGVYASPGYLRQHGAPGLDGDGHSLILMDSDDNDLADTPWIRARLPKASVQLRASSRYVQAQFCGAGCGLAVLPRMLGDTMAGLALVDLGAPPPGRDVWAGYHQDLKRAPRLRALLDMTLAALQPAGSPPSPSL